MAFQFVLFCLFAIYSYHENYVFGRDAFSVVQTCSRTNEFYECGSPCQNRCDDLEGPCKVMSYRCIDACFCIPGFARNSNDVCVPEWQCPQFKNVPNEAKCIRQNEEFRDCHNACENTCSRLHEICPILTKRCYSGCYCKINFARDALGNCIAENECPTEQCQLNEVYECRHYPCQESCSTLGECKLQETCVEDCYCRRGFIRNELDKCIPQWQCYSKKL